MTPKEKAQELISKFLIYHLSYNDQLYCAKECALIVVDEILSEIRQGMRLDWIHERDEGQDYIVYWAKVKSEITNLQN